jgi:tRNA(Leu) C34 or U34 (ribose-2'-O)-methylase TrmL
MRGYAAIGLYAPIDEKNVGSAMRAVAVYEAAFLAITGKTKTGATDTGSYYKHIPFFRVDNLKDIIPYDCVPIAVDLVDGAQNIITYQHPERAFYIFGPENGTLGNNVLSWCRDKIQIPKRWCMNLAATVNVVLYDRMVKGWGNGSTE